MVNNYLVAIHLTLYTASHLVKDSLLEPPLIQIVLFNHRRICTVISTHTKSYCSVNLCKDIHSFTWLSCFFSLLMTWDCLKHLDKLVKVAECSRLMVPFLVSDHACNIKAAWESFLPVHKKRITPINLQFYHNILWAN